MSSPRETAPHSRPSIRRLASIGLFGFGIIAITVSVALITISSSLERTVDAVIHDTESRAIASRLQLDLLTYQRHSNLFVLTAEESADDARDELASEIRESLLLATQGSEGAREDEILEQVERNVGAYFEKRNALEAQGLTLEQAVTDTRAELNAAIESLESLRDLNRRQVVGALAQARTLQEAATLTGWIAGAALVLGFLLVALGVERLLLRPILELEAAMARFRSGDVAARRRGGGLREIARLTDGFNDMAESLERQRSDQLTFLAGVAHDLRNPLNGLKLGLHALEQEQSPASRARVRERLDRQVERLGRMVDDLLDATRIEAGALELRVEPIDLREIVDEMVRLYEPTSPNHRIVEKLPPDPVILSGDSLRIEQVVSNLLSNAIKYSPRGGSVTVSLDTEDGDALLAVADQGVGIAAGEIADLFLPFRRRRENHLIPGAGLGLSVVRRIVTAHGGSIEVESEPGSGTTFRIRLPRSANTAS